MTSRTSLLAQAQIASSAAYRRSPAMMAVMSSSAPSVGCRNRQLTDDKRVVYSQSRRSYASHRHRHPLNSNFIHPNYNQLQSTIRCHIQRRSESTLPSQQSHQPSDPSSSTADLASQQNTLMNEASYLTRALYRNCLKSVKVLAKGVSCVETRCTDNMRSARIIDVDVLHS